MEVRGVPHTKAEVCMQKFEEEIREGFIKEGAFFKHSERAERITQELSTIVGLLVADSVAWNDCHFP